MQIDMIVKDKATRLWTIVGLCSLGLCITACDTGELPADSKDPAKIALRFSASISDNPSTRATQPPQPTITQGTAFAADKAHTFGMFVTLQDGTALTTGSDDNMKSILTQSGTTQSWKYTSKNDSPISLDVKNGESVMIKGYYPWTADATATAVPFDLSSTDPHDWTDLLYLSSPTDAQTITDGTRSIALTFSHAFCWVTVNLLQLSANNTVKVKAVNIGNAYAGQGTIINKGKLNLNTGKITNPTSGPLKIVMKQPINLDTEGETGAQAAVFNFLVPPVMSTAIRNSDIVIEVTTLEDISGGKTEEKVLTFPLSLTHLNKDQQGTNTLYGFQQGKHNTYHIVYNNSAMNLSLSDWQAVEITDAKLGEGTVNANYTTRKFTNDDNTVLGSGGTYTLTVGNHIYHTYLGEVAENNNGEYKTSFSINPSGNLSARWKGAVESEPVYPSLYIAENFAAGGAQVPWQDQETGALMAKQACVEFRDGGFTDWRLPRISECYMMTYQFAYSIKECWSATEASSMNSYAMVKGESSGYYPKSCSKQDYFYVRCVRDSDIPKPTI